MCILKGKMISHLNCALGCSLTTWTIQKEPKINNANPIIHALSTPDIDLKYFTRLCATSHCQCVTNNTIISVKSGVTAVLKGLNNMHDRIVKEPNNPDKILREKKRSE